MSRRDLTPVPAQPVAGVPLLAGAARRPAGAADRRTANGYR